MEILNIEIFRQVRFVDKIFCNFVLLEKIKEDGFDKLYAQTALRAKATQEALKAIGMEIYPKTPALAMTTIYTEQSSAIRKILKNKYNVNISRLQVNVCFLFNSIAAFSRQTFTPSLPLRPSPSLLMKFSSDFGLIKN